MAGFDKSLDVEKFGEDAQFEGTKIRVSVFSYNEGRAKLQLSRENYNGTSEDWRFAKLGRMTKEEAEVVLPLMLKALETM